MTESDFVAAVLTNPINRAILDRLPRLGVADGWLVSGALFQTVWNTLTGRAATHGIKDYDIFYFDPDMSFEVEGSVISTANALFADLDATIEIRNQARVHLWYVDKFGAPYSALNCATEGIDRFLMQNAQVGIHPRASGFDIYAPHGFDDIARMIIRPNDTGNFRAAHYREKAHRWQKSWPGVTVRPV